MTEVDKIKEVRILRHVKGLSIREISETANLSTTTIQKILKSEKTKFTYHRGKTYQPVTGPIRETVTGWLIEDKSKKKKKRRTAIRMYEILKKDYGYKGSYESIKKCVRQLKKSINLVKKEAYIPLAFDPGEAFQFDWGEVEAYINNELIKLNLAVVVLCYSRYFYARIYPCQKQEFMLDAHKQAFQYFGGVCERGIYDNMKTAVQGLLKGRHRNVNERFRMFCSHYLFEPDFCTPARGNEKGRVENKVGFVRRNFFVPVLKAETIDELNDSLLDFCDQRNRATKHPEYREKTYYEVYLEEKESLITLPGYDFECCRPVHTVVSPTSRVYFEKNWYSVPADYVNRPVLVKGYVNTVGISFNGREITRHKREYGQYKFIYDPYHYLSILEKKPGAIRNGAPFRDWQLPEIFNTYRKLLNEHYKDGDIYYAKTLILLKDWPIQEVVAAIEKSVSLGVLGDSYILSMLRRKNEPEDEDEHVSVRIELTRYKARQRPLKDYDIILRLRKEKENNEHQETKDNGIPERSQIRWFQESL